MTVFSLLSENPGNGAGGFFQLSGDGAKGLNYAVQLLEQGIGNRVVGLKQGEVVDVDIQEALKMKKAFPADLYKMADEISF